MTRQEFAALHVGGNPLILFNVWDAGSALAVANAGTKAIATGSHSVAGAQGFADGEEIPLASLLETSRRIANAISLPLTVDFETGFAEELDDLAENGRKLLASGAIGCNFEDQLFGTSKLRDVSEQGKRIAVLNELGLFVNARTDTFLNPLKIGESPNQADLVESAIERGRAYANAGAGCYFIPGLSDPDMIAEICQAIEIPVNVMRLDDLVDNTSLAALGFARISYGPAPWRNAMMSVQVAAQDALRF